MRSNRILLISGIAISSMSYAQKAERPNIVIILADDLGWGDVGFHGSDTKTPNLDGLANDGIILNRFYTAPISSPTRAGLMTGKYPNRFGIRENVIPPWRDFGLDTQEETLADMLGEAGYKNRAIIGKWHLGHSKKEYYPLNRGFTYFYGHLNGAIDYFTHEREGQLDWHKNWESCYDKGYSTNLITKEAVNCINSYTKENDPFFLYVAYNAPHTPLQAEPEDIALYTDNIEALSKKDQKKVTFSAMVTCMDRGIGEIRKALKNNGIEDNTIVIFFSDNGAQVDGGGENTPLRGGKFMEWDGGVRVPALVHYPDKFKGKRQVEQVVGFVDIMPTLLKQAKLEKRTKKTFDGIDISDILTGKTDRIDRDFYLGCGAIVNNDYKLILPNKGGTKLSKAFLNYYRTSPYEKENSIDSHADEAKRLKKEVKKYDAIEPPYKLPSHGEGSKGFKAPFEWKVEP